MKFNQLFDDSLRPKWDDIFSLKCFETLKSTQQSIIWHKEGNVANHTMLVTDKMCELLNKTVQINDRSKLILMSAALCHDLGKGVTTKFDEDKKDFTCKRHALASENIVRRMFFDEDVEIREQVCWLVKNHMQLFYIFDELGNVNFEKLKSLYRHDGVMSVAQLMALNRCDRLGSLNDIDTDEKIKDCNAKIWLALNTMKRNEELEACLHEDKQLGFTVYMMIGIPGSGKDTWIQNNIPDIPMLSRDVIRKEIGIEGEKPQGNEVQENEVSNILRQRLIDLCNSQTTCVINNCNVSRKRRNEIKDIIQPYEPKIVYVYVEAPSVEDCFNRREGQISRKVIKRMLSSFEFPEKWEYDEIIIHKQKY